MVYPLNRYSMEMYYNFWCHRVDIQCHRIRSSEGKINGGPGEKAMIKKKITLPLVHRSRFFVRQDMQAWSDAISVVRYN